MRASATACLSASVLFLVATCGQSVPPPPTSSASPAASAEGEWCGVTPNPLDVQVAVDVDSAEKLEVGPAGGVIRAVGDDGAKYRLDVPAGALISDTTLVMTPVKSISGWPVQPLASWAVLLEPDDLELMRDATLTIEPPQPVPAIGQGAFSFHGDGEDVGFEAIVPDPHAISIPLSHFSGHGFVWDVRQSFWVAMQDYRQGQAEAEFADKVTRTLVVERDLVVQDDRARAALRTALEGMAEVLKQRGQGEIDVDKIVDDLPRSRPDFDSYERLAQVFEEYYERVLRPRFELASRDCTQALKAVSSLYSLHRLLQLVGAQDLVNRFTTERARAGRPLRYPLDAVPQAVLDMVRTNCDKEAYESCARTGDLGRLLTYVFTLRRVADLFGAPLAPADDRHNLLELCGRYEVEANFEIAMTRKIFGQIPWFEGEYDWMATITFLLRYEDAATFSTSVAGSGTPDILDASERIRFRLSGQDHNGVIDLGWEPWCQKKLTFRPGPPMDAEIRNLDFIRAGPDGETIRLRDAKLVFGQFPPVLVSGPGCGLSAGFEERGGFGETLMAGGFPDRITWPTVTDWTIDDHPVLATKSWQHTTLITAPDDVGRSETTYRHNVDLTIRHTPGVLR